MSHTSSRTVPLANRIPHSQASSLRVPTYFFLSQADCKATFLNEKPTNIRFQTQVPWKSQEKYIILCADAPSQDISVLNHYVELDDERYPPKCIPLLKNHLRQCIRKQKPSLAVRTAFHLIKFGFPDFLELIVECVVEESVPNPQFGGLVWLLCAVNNGFQPPGRLFEWVTGLVAAVASSNFYEDIRSDETVDQVAIYQIATKVADQSKKDLLYSLALAAEVIRSHRTKRLLNCCISLWYNRFITDSRNIAYIRTHYLISLQSLDHIRPLDLEEWELTAIDHTCTDISSLFYMELSQSEQARYGEAAIKCVLQKAGMNGRRKITHAHSVDDGNTWKRIGRPGVSEEDVDRLLTKYAETIVRLQKKLLRNSRRKS
ncbi:hypothetical protein BC832DRAFT_208044 [Gaertneriomyces semiglobifer]|nr:hypothetical protein BC832DRAFT_208044 [Gaertneriomyces semiglobifer]